MIVVSGVGRNKNLYGRFGEREGIGFMKMKGDEEVLREGNGV